MSKEDYKDFSMYWHYAVKPVFETHSIEIQEWTSYQDQLSKVRLSYLRCLDQEVRKALIALGWTPPNELSHSTLTAQPSPHTTRRAEPQSEAV